VGLRVLIGGVLLALILPGGGIVAQAETMAETALTEFPYTPGLDTASMDLRADPCVDFYQYACGGWMDRNPIPNDQAHWSVYGKLYSDNQRFLWGILAALAPGSLRSTAQQKIGDHFAACMDEGHVELQGLSPVQPLLKQIASMRHRRDLPEVLAAVDRNLPNANALFGFGASQDLSDSTKMIAFVTAAGLGLPDRDYYLAHDQRTRDIRAAYLAHIQRLFVLGGMQEADAEHDARQVLALETRLARASLSKVDQRDPYKLFHPMSFGKLTALAPAFDWKTYTSALGAGDLPVANVTEPAFLTAVNTLLRDVPLGSLQAYLRLHVLDGAAPYLSANIDAEHFSFYGHLLHGVPQQKPRWKRCVELVDQQLGDALGAEFVARAFSKDLKESALQMAQQIEAEMRDDIARLDWMSPATKQQALEKLAGIVNKIGYPERWRDYSSIEIRADDLFGNVVRANRYEVARDLAKIGKPVDRAEWGMTPPTVNAYYSPQMNDINFPAGVLQPPLYDPQMDAAPNYGNTGGTIGHELTHGFDDEGRKFDATGNLRDWWTPADAKAFDARAQCVVDQYAGYVIIDDIPINSRLTLGEDLADLGGLILAHAAWRHASGLTPLPARDGLSAEQRFFVGYAQWACEHERPESLRVHAKTDPHSPGRYRVNGLVANMPEFAAAFTCRAGQPMARENRCRVW
jgi:putative endopeptidase